MKVRHPWQQAKAEKPKDGWTKSWFAEWERFCQYLFNNERPDTPIFCILGNPGCRCCKFRAINQDLQLVFFKKGGYKYQAGSKRKF
jgi:hypothetical protein